MKTLVDTHFAHLASYAHTAPAGTLVVDALDQPYGRDALAAAAGAAMRSDFHHKRNLDALKSRERLRKALQDAIGAAKRITDEANLGMSASAAMALRLAAEAHLASLPPPEKPKRGTAGRPVRKAAAEAAAEVWEIATGRTAPRGGVKSEGRHPLELLLNAIGRDLFVKGPSERDYTLTCEFLRDREKLGTSRPDSSRATDAAASSKDFGVRPPHRTSKICRHPNSPALLTDAAHIALRNWEMKMTESPSPAMRGGMLQTEAATALGITPRTLRRWSAKGFGPKPIGQDAGRLLFDASSVAAFAAGVR